jgi:hypothetical protein
VLASRTGKVLCPAADYRFGEGFSNKGEDK